MEIIFDLLLKLQIVGLEAKLTVIMNSISYARMTYAENRVE